MEIIKPILYKRRRRRNGIFDGRPLKFGFIALRIV
jgi:hypothetical protein